MCTALAIPSTEPHFRTHSLVGLRMPFVARRYDCCCICCLATEEARESAPPIVVQVGGFKKNYTNTHTVTTIIFTGFAATAVVALALIVVATLHSYLRSCAHLFELLRNQLFRCWVNYICYSHSFAKYECLWRSIVTPGGIKRAVYVRL